MPDHAAEPADDRTHAARDALRSRPLRLTGRAFGALISIALLVLAGFAWLSYRDLDSGVTRLPIAVGRPDRPGAKDVDGTDQNILLVGNDDRSTMTDDEVRELKVGRDGGSLATDTMMIVHIPADGSRATLISLPRDTKIDLPGYGQVLLNAPYALAYQEARGDHDAKRTAGANALLAELKRLTGLTFDHYVQVDLLGFYRISNALGGVPVTMCAAVNDTVAYNRDVRGEDGGSGLVLPKGRTVLDGAKALQFVRQRHGFPTGDFYRVKRQQYFLTAAFRRVASVGILFELRRLKDALARSVFVDDGLDNLLDLSGQLENLTADRIVGQTIPVELDGTNDPARIRRFVTALVAPSRRPSTAPSASRRPSSPRPARSTPIDAGCIR